MVGKRYALNLKYYIRNCVWRLGTNKVIYSFPFCKKNIAIKRQKNQNMMKTINFIT